MKVITEERLVDIFTTRFINEETQQLLINECQELDTLTVTRLRPISDVQEGWLVKPKYSDGFEHCIHISTASGQITTSTTDNMYVLRDNFEGCIPMPIYEPKKV